MATTTITATNATLTGYNLTDSGDFDTLTTGAGNGVEFEYYNSDLLVLKNTTGGPATFTLKLKTFAGLSDYSVTPTDPTVVIATGKTYVVKLSETLQQSTGNVIVECDVAGEALVLRN